MLDFPNRDALFTEFSRYFARARSVGHQGKYRIVNMDVAKKHQTPILGNYEWMKKQDRLRQIIVALINRCLNLLSHAVDVSVA